MGENLSRRFATMSEEERAGTRLEMEEADSGATPTRRIRSWSSASRAATTAPRRRMWRTGTTLTLQARMSSTRGGRAATPAERTGRMTATHEGISQTGRWDNLRRPDSSARP